MMTLFVAVSASDSDIAIALPFAVVATGMACHGNAKIVVVNTFPFAVVARAMTSQCDARGMTNPCCANIAAVNMRLFAVFVACRTKSRCSVSFAAVNILPFAAVACRTKIHCSASIAAVNMPLCAAVARAKSAHTRTMTIHCGAKIAAARTTTIHCGAKVATDTLPRAVLAIQMVLLVNMLLFAALPTRMVLVVNMLLFAALPTRMVLVVNMLLFAALPTRMVPVVDMLLFAVLSIGMMIHRNHHLVHLVR
jgi:hypothetical protein